MHGRSMQAALAGMVAALALMPAPGAADTLVVVNSLRPGITVKTLVLTPVGPAKATVILLPGGDGWLAIDDALGEPTRLTGNFLVRTRQGLVGQSFRTVLVDAPSDRQDATGLTGGFRTTVAHAQDLAAVVQHFVPNKYITFTILGITIQFPNPDPWSQLPGAVVGTSASAVSAALSAFNPGTTVPNPNVTGVALTASVTTGPDSINNLSSLNAIKQPVFFVHHVDDGCAAAQYIEATAAAYNMMVAGVNVGFAEIKGGEVVVEPDPCDGATRHGFRRAGAPALDAIKRWLLTLKR